MTDTRIKTKNINRLLEIEEELKKIFNEERMLPLWSFKNLQEAIGCLSALNSEFKG